MPRTVLLHVYLKITTTKIKTSTDMALKQVGKNGYKNSSV
jgi:hypothetical protein